jgi:RNA polymerase sigma-70 factor, ECF subfamily
MLDAGLRDDLLRALASVRAFALSLTGDADRADDLVQETLVRALSYIDRFEPGTNLRAWLFTILRNQFHTGHRKRWREVEDPDGVFAAKLATVPDQGAKLEFQDFRAAFAKLAPQHREALVLIGAEGLTYEEAARVCGINIGTLKSRVSRARSRLAELLGEDMRHLGPDRVFAAAANGAQKPDTT